MNNKNSMVYLCDVAKNKDCPKTNCINNGGPCYCTLDKEFAVKNEDGQLIKINNKGDISYD